MQVAWTAKRRMQEGQAAHSQWQTHRAEQDTTFKRESSISCRLIVGGWEVVISGRMDGLSFDNGTWVVEELKSSTALQAELNQITLDDVPSWRKQVELYLFFLEKEGKISKGRLILVSISDGSFHTISVPANSKTEEFIVRQLLYVISEHERHQNWLLHRQNAVLSGLPFPHEEYRDGQESLVQELENALAEEHHVLLNAPTGYGKTAAALYAALMVAYRAGASVFFATARTTQQLMVEECVERLAELGTPIRAVSIRAKEKICLNEVVNCRPDACRYAVGYHDKVRDRSLLAKHWSKVEGKGGAWPDTIVEIAEENQACPYAMSIELATKADVVIGDYNYLFGPNSRLNFIESQPGQWIFIIDEVHNLPDRAMGYGSPHISLFKAWQAWDACESSMLFRPYSEPMREISTWLFDKLSEGNESEWSTKIELNLDLGQITRWTKDIEAMALEYALENHKFPLFSQDEIDPWTETAFSIIRFHQALQNAGEETVVIWKIGPLDRFRNSRESKRRQKKWGKDAMSLDPQTGVQLLCRDPAKLLSSHFDKAMASISMSATLQPFQFYQDLLGLSEDRVRLLSFPSPFPPENCAQFVVGGVSTAYRDRERDRSETAKLISDALAGSIGNTAVFFPSFRMLDDISTLLNFKGRPVLIQRPRMPENERQELLDILQRGEGHVLLGVLGGIFSEGVDLPSKALLCSIVVGPSLPQASLGRRLLQQWYQKRYGKGFQYAWLVPGMAKVGQAAGRVIRGPNDVGTIVLIGQRFLQPSFQECLPVEWSLMNSTDIFSDLTQFWDIVDEPHE